MKQNRILLCLILFLTLAQEAFAKPTPEDYGKLPSVSSMALSPNGKSIAFRQVDDDRDRLIVYALDKKTVLNAVNLAEINPGYIYFVSDTQLIVRVEEHKWAIGGKKHDIDHSAAYVFNIVTNTLEQLLTPGDKIYWHQARVGNVVGISGDRQYAFMPAFIDTNENHAADLHITAIGSLSYALMRVDLSSPSMPTRMEKGNKDTIDYFVGKKGVALIQERYNHKKKEHRLLVKKGKKWKDLYRKITDIPSIHAIGLTPDYKSLVFTQTLDNENTKQYFSMSVNNAKVEQISYGRDDMDVDHILTDTNRIAHGIVYAGFLPSYKMFNKKADNLVQKAVSKFPQNSVYIKSWSDNWQKVLFRVSGPNASGDYYLMDQQGQLTFLGAEYSNIKPDDIHPITSTTITARDALKIPTLITIPREKIDNIKNLPAIMLPHGGPESYNRIGFHWLAQALANEGYIVIQPQFRGSSGFGAAHTEAGYGEWGRKMQDDITDVLAFLVDKQLVDKQKVCIAGFSYGGYAALAGGAFTSDLYRCIVSINGVADLPAFIKNKKHDYGRQSWGIRYFNEIITTDLTTEALEAISPAHHAGNFKAPVLLLHAENDRNVRFDQANRMASSLKKAGKEFTFVKLTEENHYVDTGKSRMLTVTTVVNFINKYLAKE